MKSVAICIAALVLAGCAKNIDTTEAVRDGIIKDIGKKVDVQNMDVSVDSVSFREKEATASVSFRPKGGDRSQSISMTYALERKGDEWHVKDRNMQRHEQANPATGAPGPVTPGAQLPPGHPQMGAAPEGAKLPPGHPQLNQ